MKANRGTRGGCFFKKIYNHQHSKRIHKTTIITRKLMRIVKCIQDTLVWIKCSLEATQSSCCWWFIHINSDQTTTMPIKKERKKKKVSEIAIETPNSNCRNGRSIYSLCMVTKSCVLVQYRKILCGSQQPVTWLCILFTWNIKPNHMHWLPAIIHIPGITAFAELRREKTRAEVVQKDT